MIIIYTTGFHPYCSLSACFLMHFHPRVLIDFNRTLAWRGTVWDTKKEPDSTFYKHIVHCVWVIAILLTVYLPCCQHRRANTNGLEVSYTLFLGYYDQLLIRWGLITYSVNGFLFPTLAWNTALCWALDSLKPELLLVLKTK